MAYETINQSPSLTDFTSLEEHQAQTPGTFFGAKPVLHLHAQAAKLCIAQEQLASQTDFERLLGREVANAPSSNDDEFKTAEIEVWVTSSHLTLFSTAESFGLQIPYPTISIHAQDGNAVLLELVLSPPDTNDDDLVFLQIRVIPATVQHHDASNDMTTDQGRTNGDSSSAVLESGPSTALYKAISACQELNPDTRPENMDDDDEGGAAFDETAPGATGWITSENMAEYLDADGNFRFPSGAGDVAMIGENDNATMDAPSNNLGDGAGRRRPAAEIDVDEDGQPGTEDETKWQRTG